jgi:DNA-binding IclR family transcriptional regulator
MSQTLDRALSILDLLAEKPRRINDVAEHLGVHHSTALRLLHTLRAHGFAKELPDHSYRLGAATFRLAFTALEGIDLRSVARPFMEQLNEETGETIHLATLEDGDVVYIEKVEARHRVRMHSSIGGIAELHCTAIAKALLAYQSEAQQDWLISSHPLTRFTEHTLTTAAELRADIARIKERGYAINNEETEPGMLGIGAPIFGGDETMVGAMSVVAPSNRVDRASLEGLAPALLAACDGVSREFGRRVS